MGNLYLMFCQSYLSGIIMGEVEEGLQGPEIMNLCIETVFFRHDRLIALMNSQ